MYQQEARVGRNYAVPLQEYRVHSVQLSYLSHSPSRLFSAFQPRQFLFNLVSGEIVSSGLGPVPTVRRPISATVY
jgi:hypothetical protein